MGLLANPRQTVLVTCRSHVEVMGKKVEKDNAITVGWHMPVSFEPQIYAISIGKSRFSHKIITEGKCFVVNFIPLSMKEAAVICGRRSGEHLDKFKLAGLKTDEAENVDCFRISGAIGYLECEVFQEIDVGDHTIFLGKVMHGELIKEGKRLFHTDGDKFTTTK
jgi:flavin reductase (DIM6/NTAB) family NADH-FMN oxidoreductase RutF